MSFIESGRCNGYLHGESATAICASPGCSRAWLYRWIARYVTDDPTWAASRSRAPHRRPQAVASAVRDEILRARTRLADDGVFCGPNAIRWALEDRGQVDVPAVRTIARVLATAGVTRPRRAGPYQPKGTPYPAPVAATPSAVHQSDFVGPCRLRGAPRFYSLHSVDVATGRVAVAPLGCRQAQAVINAFWASWQRLGLPTIQQIDNEPVFYGNRARPRGFGPLMRLCLSVGVQPWFIPVAEPWRNGVVERFNDWWRQKGPLTRLVLPDHAALRSASWDFEARHNAHARYSKLNGRTPNQALHATARTVRFPATLHAPQHPMGRPVAGHIHVVRLIRDNAIFARRRRATTHLPAGTRHHRPTALPAALTSPHVSTMSWHSFVFTMSWHLTHQSLVISN